MTSYYYDDLVDWARWKWWLGSCGRPPACRRPTSRPPSSTTTSPLRPLSARGARLLREGEAKDFVRDGNIELGGGLPVNTHGGQLGEAYLHGMNGIAEGVRLVRGTSVNQVPDVNHVLVTAGTGVPTSGLILGVD